MSRDIPKKTKIGTETAAETKEKSAEQPKTLEQATPEQLWDLFADAWEKGNPGSDSYFDVETFWEALAKGVKEKFPSTNMDEINLGELLEKYLENQAQRIMNYSNQGSAADRTREEARVKVVEREREIKKQLMESPEGQELTKAEEGFRLTKGEVDQQHGRKSGDPEIALQAEQRRFATDETEVKAMQKEVESISWWKRNVSDRVFAEERQKSLERKQLQLAKDRVGIKSFKRAVEAYKEASRVVQEARARMQKMYAEAKKGDPGLKAANLAYQEASRRVTELSFELDSDLIDFQEFYHMNRVQTPFRNDWPDWSLDEKSIFGNRYRDDVMKNVEEVMKRKEARA